MSIPPQCAAFVQDMIASGAFGTEEEVIVAALVSLERERLRAQLVPALEQLARGEGELLQANEIDGFFDAIVEDAERELEAERRESR